MIVNRNPLSVDCIKPSFLKECEFHLIRIKKLHWSDIHHPSSYEFKEKDILTVYKTIENISPIDIVDVISNKVSSIDIKNYFIDFYQIVDCSVEMVKRFCFLRSGKIIEFY
jgi:hypothetical protein